MVDYVPRLAAFLDQLGWSPERLAREINRVGGEGTVSVKAPYGWLKGAYPRGRIPDLVASILTERLGRIVDASQIWPRKFVDGAKSEGDDGAILDLPWSEENVGRPLQSLVDYPGPSDSPPLVPVSGVDLVAVAVDWLTGESGPVRSRSGGDEVAPAVVDLLVTRADQLRQLDEARSGPLVAQWVAHDLSWAVGLARQGSFDVATGIRLYGAIAEMAQLAGWLHSDRGDWALGQHYLLAGLRAANLAGDRALGAYILSCLSYQLTWLGNGRDALRLIRIAWQGADESVGNVVRSLLATRQARAHARLGDEAACEIAVAKATELLGGKESGPTPRWANWVTPAVLVTDAGRAYLELGRAARAENRLVTGLRQLDERQRRNTLLHQMSVAQARLELGRVDGAAEVTRRALDLAGMVDSGRARDRLKTVRSGFTSYDAAAAYEAVEDIDDFLSSSRMAR